MENVCHFEFSSVTWKHPRLKPHPIQRLFSTNSIRQNPEITNGADFHIKICNTLIAGEMYEFFEFGWQLTRTI